jgi:Na+/H+-dicarboxylate symporter
MRKLELHWQILIAIVVAGIIGGYVHNVQLSTGVDPTIAGIKFISIFEYVGTIFLNALKMIIVPLIMSSIIVGVAGIGSGGNLGALGGKTLLFYASTTLAAILVGLLLINAVGPGYVNGEPARDLLALEASTEELAESVAGKGPGDVAKVFQRMVPPNIVKAAVEGQMLGIIFFAILFGYFMTKLDNQYAEPLYRFWDARHDAHDRVDHEVCPDRGIRARRGRDCQGRLQGDRSTGRVFVTLPLLLRFVGRVNPFKTIKGAVQAMLTAFSTASSSATLPVTMECVEDNIGVSNKVSSFVLPLGATVNMNGTALYECAAAMFIAQAYGLELTFGVQFSIVAIALMTSIGVAGVPSASLVAIAIILGAIGLPIEALGVLLVFDRILDMARTSINVWGDVSCATIVARLEGEKTNVGVGDPETEPA